MKDLKGSEKYNIAPGAPGEDATWMTGAKSAIGKSMNTASDVTFTMSNGIVNEVFFPREDIACIQKIECAVAGAGSDVFFETEAAAHQIEWMEEGVPAFSVLNRDKHDRCSIRKEVITDPIRNTLLQQIEIGFAGKDSPSACRFFIFVSPHLVNMGMDNTGWKDAYKGVPMLFAERENTFLAIAFSIPVVKCSVGYAGASDGYSDLRQHGHLQWDYDKAEKGNIVLSAEFSLPPNTKLVMAIGFGHSTDEAGNNAWSSLLDGFNIAKAKYIYEWQRWQRSLANVKSDRNRLGRDFRKSAAVLRIHESRKFPGGIIASMSKPWGFARGDKDGPGGYHLVWPRDLALSSGGFLELKAKDDVLRIMNYLMATQEDDGHWSQNMWLAGHPHWSGIQMDQVALPLLLVGAAFSKGFVSHERCRRYWPGIKKALAYIVRNGPYTPQDRWEEEAGYTPFTLSTQIAALLTGAALARANGEDEIAASCTATADYWNGQIEKWTYVTHTHLCQEVGVEGYYIRINPFDKPADDVKERTIDLKNHSKGDGIIQIGDLVSVDALALVRFGLRDAHDVKILNTIKVIDHVLKTETPYGPCWHRYNHDGYGEDAKGNPYSGTGIGRAWPLLTGERAHYEIAAGNFDEAKRLLKAVESFASNSLLPEQVWDTDDIPEKGLFFGRPSGSAMPLTWAHAEYLKLCSSIKHRRIADMPEYTQERYIKNRTTSNYEMWSFQHQNSAIPEGKILRILLDDRAMVRWSDNAWESAADTISKDSGLGYFYADLESKDTAAQDFRFTFFWEEAGHWEEKNFAVQIVR